MSKETFTPPKEFTHNKHKYIYLETKKTNSKGEKLSEECHWYLVNEKREPMSKGNIETLIASNT